MALPEDLKRLIKKQATLSTEFDESLLIRDLWPDAFKIGRVTTFISGLPSKGFYYTIKRKEDGETKEFKIHDIPKKLIHRHEQFLIDCKAYLYGRKWLLFAEDIIKEL